jgi:pimeloyl-ACP methyl ester carboxylesterase
MLESALSHLDINGTRIAYRLRRGGDSPTLVFLPGYASDMDGDKALALDFFAAIEGLAMLRFDYSGTGSSSGDFADGTLGGWLDEALYMLDHLTNGPVILLGSSMGGWLALLIAKLRPARIAAVVGIASAPDFTDWGFSDEQKDVLRQTGRLEESNPYGPKPFVTTLGFWTSGESLRLLDGPIAVDCPVRLVHGDSDPEVPLEIAFRTLRQLRSGDVQLLVLKGGSHRLSEPHEIEAILRTVGGLLETD